jgi:hypothetical protein
MELTLKKSLNLSHQLGRVFRRLLTFLHSGGSPEPLL